MFDPDIDLLKTVILEEDPQPLFVSGSKGSNTKADIISYRVNKIEVNVDSRLINCSFFRITIIPDGRPKLITGR